MGKIVFACVHLPAGGAEMNLNNRSKSIFSQFMRATDHIFRWHLSVMHHHLKDSEHTGFFEQC
jgi:hypothetical protein